MPRARVDRARVGKIAAVVAVVLAPILIFAPHLHGTYFWDDLHLVRDHPLLHAPDGWRRVFTTELLEGAGKEKTQFYHPLPLLSLWIQYQLGAGFDGLRLANILLHTMNVVLVARLFTRLRLRPATTLLASAAFAVQPLAAEPTMLICGRHDTIAVGFALLAMLVGLGPVDAAARNLRTQTGARFAARVAGVTLFSLAACVSKEACFAAVPIAALAFALSWVSAPDPRSSRGRAAVLVAAPFAGIVSAFAIRRALDISAASAQIFAPLREHLTNYGTILGEYTQYILLFTNGTTTRVYRPYAFLPALAVVVVAAAIFLGALAWLGRDLRIRARDDEQRAAEPWTASARVVFGLAWFLVSLGPHILSLPILGMWGNRYGYFPSIGLWLAAFAAIEAALLQTKPSLQRLAVVASIVPLLLAAINTSAIAVSWHDGVSLFLADVKREPDNELALYDLGVEVERVGGCEEALPMFEKAVALKPTYWRAVHNVAGCLIRLQRFADAEPAARQAHALAPTNAGSLLNLALVELRLGHVDEARGTLATGLALYPHSEPLQSVQREIEGIAPPIPPPPGR